MNPPESFLSEYEQALATASWAKVAPLIHEKCAVTFSEGTYIGKAEVEAAFRKTFTLIKDERYSISNVHWIQKTEDIAVYIYDFSWSGTIRGEPASGSGRGTSLLVNQDGKWQLICEHLGPPPK